MYDTHDLEVLLRSSTPMLFCSTSDERRVLSLICSAPLTLNKVAWKWTCVHGLSRLTYESEPQTSLADPEKLLTHLCKLKTPGVFALLDFHHYLDEPKNIRLLKEIALAAEEQLHTLVFISHQIDIPVELAAYSAK